MTDKEFKQLSRAQLLDIIYEFQLQVDKLEEEKKALEQALQDKRLRINNAGNLAEAALEINDCFRNAQNAADHYLNEIKIMYEEAQLEREKILEAARVEAQEYIANERKKQRNYDSAIDTILKGFGRNHSKNG